MITSAGLDVSAALTWVEAQSGPIVHARELTGGFTSAMLAITLASAEELVVRLITQEPWRTHGADLARREHDVQLLLADSGLPVPRSVALDADGRETGHPAHLMTLLPGDTDTGRVDHTSLGQLADLLATVHAVPPTDEIRTYQSWAWEAKYVVPDWALDDGLWRGAFELLRGEPPAYDPCLIHRDFHLRNVLWETHGPSGVVDWVETSIGPAWLDVAHCRTNLALDHGEAAGDAFVRAYVVRMGALPAPHFEVMDAVGFLPPPGKRGFVTSDLGRRRLEERLRNAMHGKVGS